MLLASHHNLLNQSKLKEAMLILSYRYLGNIIDSKLRGNLNVSRMYKKCHQRLYVLRKLKKVNVDSTILTLFYKSIIQSDLPKGYICVCCTILLLARRTSWLKDVLVCQNSSLSWASGQAVFRALPYISVTNKDTVLKFKMSSKQNKKCISKKKSFCSRIIRLVDLKKMKFRCADTLAKTA